MAAISGDLALKRGNSREALWFYVIACSISWAIWLPVLLEGLGFTHWLASYDPQWFYKFAYGRAVNNIDVLTIAGGLGPLTAAVWITWHYHGPAAVKRLFARALPPRVAWYWYLIAFCIPLGYHSIAGLVEMAQGYPFPIGTPQTPGAVTMSAWAFFYSVATMTVFIIVEELGWRGVMQPALQRHMSALKAALIVGVAWAYWHLPFFINLNYVASGSLSDAVINTALAPMFTIPTTILLGWILNSTSGSVFLCMLTHAVNNSAVRLFTHSEAAGQWVRIGAWLMAILVLLVFGARDLSRKPRYVPE